MYRTRPCRSRSRASRVFHHTWFVVRSRKWYDLDGANETLSDEYPDNHVFFCSVQLEDDTYDPPAHIRAIAESVASYGSIPIDTLFRMVLRKCSTLTDRSDEESVSDEANTDAAEDQDEDQYEEDYFDADLDLELPDHKLEIDWQILQRYVSMDVSYRILRVSVVTLR